MPKYVKKRIPIEAVQTGKVRGSELRKFANNLIILDGPEDDFDTGYYAVYDRLHDTWVQFKIGDWIAKGVQGEFYPIEKDVFEQTYDEYVENPEPETVPPVTNSEPPRYPSLLDQSMSDRYMNH